MPTRAPKPWDKPVRISAGDESPTAIHTAVGLALSNWEHVENTKVLLFGGITGMPFMLALRIYGNLPSSASKQSIIRAAGDARFGYTPIYMAFFDKLMDMVDRFLARRNNIAHGVVVNRGNGHYLMPPFHIGKNFDYVKHEERYAFTSNDITNYAAPFEHPNTELLESLTLLCFAFEHRAFPETPLTRLLQPSLKNLRKLRIQGVDPPPLEPSPE
jgi:hypothetical protein